jgi:hypothetical protein
MTCQRSIFQVEFCEEFDDDNWQKIRGRLWSLEAAELRVRRLRADRPTRWYRICETKVVATTSVIWQSNVKEKTE